MAGTFGTKSITLSVLVDMDAADTATVTIDSLGEAGNTTDITGHATEIFTSFSGSLIN